VFSGPFFQSYWLSLTMELGDRTQITTLSILTADKSKQNTRFSAIIAGTFAIQALSTLFGGVLSRFFSHYRAPIEILVGILLFYAGVRGLYHIRRVKKSEGLSEQSLTTDPIAPTRLSFIGNDFLRNMLLYMLAEFGDKSQAATITMSSIHDSFFRVWLGSSLGLVTLHLALFIGLKIVKISASKLQAFGVTAMLFSGALFIRSGLMGLF